MSAGGGGAAAGVSYQETIVINIDERRFQTQLSQIEKQYQQAIERMAKMQAMQIKLTMNDQASSKMKAIQTEVSKLSQTSRTTIRVGVTDQASTRLKQIQTEVDKLSKGANVKVGTGGTATAKASSAASRAASTVSSGASSLASRLGGAARTSLGVGEDVVSGIAPELGGVAGLGALGGLGAATGVGAAVGAVAVGASAATKNAADFNHELMILQNNTTLTNEDMATLAKNVSDTSQEFGIATTPLIEASRNIMDLTQNTDAMNGVMKVAAEAAASTGADVAQTGTILASTLHQYKQDQGDVATVTQNAAHAMGVLHVSAAEGNMTMEQFAENSGRAVAFAAQLGVPLDQVGASMAALTRNGYDAAESQTQVVNMLTHIIKPASAAQKEIEKLTNTTGVDLKDAYTATGVSQLGFTGIFAKTTDAYQKMGLTQAQATDETLKLLNAQRGGIGAALLMGKGADDYDQILKDLNDDQLTGQYVSQAWAKAQKDPETQMSILQQRMQGLSRDIGGLFVGPLNGAIDVILKMADAFDHLGSMIDQSGVMDSFRAIKEGLTGDPGAFGILQHQIETTFGPEMGDKTRPFFQMLIDNRDTIRDLAHDALDLAIPFVGLTELWTNGDDVARRFGGALEGIGQAIQNVWQMIPQNVRDDLGDILNALEQRAAEWVAPMVTGVGNMMDAMGSAIHEGVTTVGGQFGAEMIGVMNNMWQGVAAWWSTAGPTIGNAIWGAVDDGLKFVKQQLGINSPSTYMRDQIGVNMMDGLITGIQSKSDDLKGVLGTIASSVGSAFSSLGSNISGRLPGGTGDVGSWIDQAIKASGVDASWAGGLNTIVMHESGGNPGAANMTDVNAQAGNASVGLMQLTGSNRSKYTPQGMDPMDPVAQIMAGIAYIKAAYGDISNVPGVKSVAAGGAYKPYDQGGLLMPGVTMAVNNTGAPEAVIPARRAQSSAAGAQAVRSGSGGPLVSIGQIVQQPGEDGESFAQRVGQIVTAHLDNFSNHVTEAFDSMPNGAFG
jgi:TP901 family phage tail tape measure protein